MTEVAMDSGRVLIEDREVDGGRIRILRLDRPEKRNALNTRLLSTLLGALRVSAEDADIRAIVLAANGPSFCAGGDTKEFAVSQHDRVVARAKILADVLEAPSKAAIPVVSAVQGAASGAGAALALSADLIIAGPGFSLAYPELPKGIVPSMVMPSAMRLGRALAFELVTTGRPLGAAEAVARGVVNRAVETDVVTAAIDVAAGYASLDRDVLATTKRLFIRQAAMEPSAGVCEGFSLLAQTASATNCYEDTSFERV
ncbi:enoyl-CoA hydratase/isomerase family protein [Gordonia sp. zg691]|uniref:Enoyl-CoA hydratase/isomerase family protein n=1 Tax=Gordonia jinghuaiqii TaxID=2758710 RepID=A0A7D7QX38_9ACTN|nr:enoyl-CoA hydratase/isomerase family protein [Gordonia jinghuaiqii]MBD0863463.1 enoyl-CoA hydratase/isomerase family protein [Gordonia jinghuaiqii]MCR5979194.1 enoyl-CoA hydratase/isomerase family protein [Gordonia jinghuaiqii]QMT00988.1 enoyl-CoA hydratase/isomerase family protein [Gordonia jinghuaiqii]